MPSNHQTCSENQQQDFLNSLSKAEKALVKKFKRVVTQGKGSKPVATLFSKEIQYICSISNSENSGCLHGYQTIKKLAEEAGVVNKNLFTSTRLRKHFATILQVINIKEDEMEQFANLMGHTKKTHESFYR
ncbi:hypothetical protein WA026_021757 [Henosepilachna vigintioctopunctata]|uniref:Uncharacterized protein n=1 Tax=Henosepilachna vigintioctopunctata TaxID=420089 RepID=A0AAW1TX19_9CUCU